MRSTGARRERSEPPGHGGIRPPAEAAQASTAGASVALRSRSVANPVGGRARSARTRDGAQHRRGARTQRAGARPRAQRASGARWDSTTCGSSASEHRRCERRAAFPQRGESRRRASAQRENARRCAAPARGANATSRRSPASAASLRGTVGFDHLRKQRKRAPQVRASRCVPAAWRIPSAGERAARERATVRSTGARRERNEPALARERSEPPGHGGIRPPAEAAQASTAGASVALRSRSVANPVGGRARSARTRDGAQHRRGARTQRAGARPRAQRARRAPASEVSDPDGIRTRVTCVKGGCPRPLDDGVSKSRTDSRGEPRWFRTFDPRLKRPVLYH